VKEPVGIPVCENCGKPESDSFYSGKVTSYNPPDGVVFICSKCFRRQYLKLDDKEKE